MKSFLGLASIIVTLSANSATLPGFRVQMLGATTSFASSLAVDSKNNIDYTTTSGDIVRFVNGVARSSPTSSPTPTATPASWAWR